MNAASFPGVSEAAPGPHPLRAPHDSADPFAWPVAVRGHAFDRLSPDEAVRRIVAFHAAGGPHRVHVLASGAESALALGSADLVLCDNPRHCLVARGLGTALPRVRSTALLRALARVAAARRWRLFALGSSAGVQPFDYLLLRAGTAPAGSYTPHRAHGFDPAEATRRIRATQPDVLLVASRAPEVLAWIDREYRTLGVPVILHLPRCAAPEPPPQRRGRRVRARDLLRRVRGLVDLWRELRPPLLVPPASGRVALDRPHPGWLDVTAGPALAHASLDADAAIWREVLQGAAHCAVNVAQVRQIDAAGLGVLLRARAACTRAGRLFVLVAPSAAVQRALSVAAVAEPFVTAPTVDTARLQVPDPRPTLVHGETRCLSWCGEIVAANAPDVWQTTAEYLRTFTTAGATLVVVDLARVRVVDAVGAALMLQVKRRGRELYAEVLFARVNADVRALLERAGLASLLLEGGQ